MASLQRLQVIAHIADPGTCQRFGECWRELEETTTGPIASAGLVVAATAEQAKTQLALLQAEAQPAVILVSDGLVQRSPAGAGEYELTSWAKEACDPFAARLLGTIAILGKCRRLPEIDRVLPPVFDAAMLRQALQRVIDRLGYLAAPAASELGRLVIIREIQNQSEMWDYFRLRHQVYSVMGYLEGDVENAPSGMELNWCDTIAIHVGAFQQDGPREKLVGCARVVIANFRNPQAEKWTRALAATDPVLRCMVEDVVPQNQLPVFDLFATYPSPILDIIFTRDRCGELSRVIVAAEHRGAGLSDVLVKFAVFQAQKKGVQRLFLECLNQHETLYEKHGFRRIEGVTGRVMGVDRSMISMELAPEEELAVGAARAGVQTLPVVAGRGYLCACKQHDCYRGSYRLYLQPVCPLPHSP